MRKPFKRTVDLTTVTPNRLSTSDDAGISNDSATDRLPSDELGREGWLEAIELAVQLAVDLEQVPATHRVAPEASGEEIKDRLGRRIGDQGVGLLQTIQEVARDVAAHSMRPSHPLYLGLIHSSPLPAGSIADLLISSLNNNVASFHQSPALSVLEQEVIAEFAKLCGFPDGTAAGMLLPSGTIANLQGLLLARQKHFPAWREYGARSLSGMPKLYVGQSSHFCIQRAAEVMGLGRRSCTDVPSTGRGEMNIDQLDELISADRDAGNVPFAVVATAGSTGTGSIDDLEAIATICRRQQIWFHVDACYGGAGMLVEPEIKRLAAMSLADSVAIDAHKWFFVPLAASVLLTRHREVQQQAFGVSASYLPDDDHPDAFEQGVPVSRRASGLAVWMTLRAHGWRTIRQAVNRNVHLARQLEDGFRRRGFRVLGDGQLSVVCARWEHRGASPDQLDRLQRAISQHVIQTGKAWFGTVVHDGETWLRLSIVNLHTRSSHIEILLNLIEKTAIDLTSLTEPGHEWR